MRLSEKTHQLQQKRPTVKTTLSLAEIKTKATDAQRMSSSDIKNRASDDAIENDFLRKMVYDKIDPVNSVLLN